MTDEVPQGVDEEDLQDMGIHGIGNDASEAGVEDAVPQQVRARTFTGRPPSKDARQKHMVTHIPYKPWCSICVAARGVPTDTGRCLTTNVWYRLLRSIIVLSVPVKVRSLSRC